MPHAKAEGIAIPQFENVLRRDARLVTAAVSLAVIVLAAIYAYTRQLTTGLIVTGLNRPAYWGMYIVNFVTFTGLSGGAVIVAGAIHAFNIRRFRTAARVAELVAIICILLALIFITLDLGRPDRLLAILLHPNVLSPLVWDVIVVNGFLTIALAFFYFDMRVDLVRLMEARPQAAWLYRLFTLGYTDVSLRARERDRKVLQALGVVGLLGAVALRTVSAWILGLTKARPGWFGAIMGPLFIVSAVVGGLALLLVCLVALRRVLRLNIDRDVIRKLGLMLLVSIPVLGYFLLAEMMTTFYAAEPAAVRVFLAMMSGVNAPVFWSYLLVGLLLPFLLLSNILLRVRRRWLSLGGLLLLPLFGACAGALGIPAPIHQIEGTLLPPWVFYSALWLLMMGIVVLCSGKGIDTDLQIGIAALMVTLGAFAERWNLVVPSLIGHSFLPFPTGSYIPSGLELLLVTGVYALGGLFFVGGAYLLPLLSSEAE